MRIRLCSMNFRFIADSITNMKKLRRNYYTRLFLSRQLHFATIGRVHTYRPWHAAQASNASAT